MKSKIKKIEQLEGRPIKEILMDDFDELGTQQAVANKYQVNQSTIVYWILKLGLQMKTTLVEVNQEQA